MEARKKYIISFLILVFVVIFFGVREFSKTKKVINVSIQESSKESSGEVQQEEKIANNQSSVISNQEEEKKVEPVVQEKTVEKKTVEPEKTVVENAKQNPLTGGEVGKIVDKLISWGFTKSSDRKIDTIILHSSYDALGNDPYSVSGIIAEYKQYEVSAHYLIDRDGVIYRLVSDQNIAWHAGVATMPDGRTNVNSFSIGVEMINTKDGKYTDEQYSAVNSLIVSLKKKYEIKNIFGHNEIAPERKTDPWGIKWDMIAK